MKLKYLLIIASIVISIQASAQTWRFGLEASPSLSWFKSDTKGFESDGSKLTFSWGFMAEYYFAENYAIASGVNLGGYGGKTSYIAEMPYLLDTISLVTKSETRLNYIEVPITVKMRTNEIGYMRYFGQFGFAPGINILAKSNVETSGPGFSASEDDVDVKKDIVPINMSLLIALGAEYSLSGNTSLVFSASFHNGFIDISDATIPDPSDLSKTKKVKMSANSLRLNLGVLF